MKYFLALATLIFAFSGHSRSPAIEPVTGLSIDHYAEIPPEKAKGYDWNSNTRPEVRNVDTVDSNSYNLTLDEMNAINEKRIQAMRSQAKAQRTISSNQLESQNNLPTAILLVVLGLLPFAIWWGLLKTLEGENPAPLKSKTLDFNAAKMDRDRQQDEDEHKKAS